MNMQNRTVLIVAVLLSLSVGSIAIAEPGERGKRDHQGFFGGGFGESGQLSARMAERLGLDEAQRQSVKNIELAAKPEITALRERMQVNRDKLKALDAEDPNRSAALNDIATETGQLATEATLLFDRIRTEVAAVLTVEQRAQLAKHLDGRGQGGRRK
jgi:Spy/CpxP family protein refolding chaperone